MIRMLPAALLAIAALAPASWAQGPVGRAGQAIDNAGRNIRRGVENAVVRGQITAQERELLNRVTLRLSWDKQLLTSTVQMEVRADGTVILRGSVIDEAAKARAVDLVENTVGVTTVVDELAVVKEVKVIEAKPPTSRVITVTPPAAVSPERQVIIKP